MESNVQGSHRVGTLAGAQDCGLPGEDVGAGGARGTSGGRVLRELLQLLLEALARRLHRAHVRRASATNQGDEPASGGAAARVPRRRAREMKVTTR